MPGSGKSTVGIILAKAIAKDYIDTDVLIQVTEGKPLQQIIDESDHMNLRAIEEKILLTLNCENKVIATGGSAAYSDKAMKHLEQTSIIIFLNVSLLELEQRITNFHERGIAMGSEQTFLDLFNERFPLYQKYADIVIECQDCGQEKVVFEIQNKLNSFKK